MKAADIQFSEVRTDDQGRTVHDFEYEGIVGTVTHTPQFNSWVVETAHCKMSYATRGNAAKKGIEHEMNCTVRAAGPNVRAVGYCPNSIFASQRAAVETAARV